MNARSAAGDGNPGALVGRAVPDLSLPATDGRDVRLPDLGSPRTVVFVYPMTGRPGMVLPPEWDTIPGARGCTAEACGFRDEHASLRAAGVDVLGLSSQSTEDQREAVDRLGLPFPVLSDEPCALADALGLPTFVAGGARRYERLTLVVAGGTIEHVFHPVPDPGGHAAEVLAWLGNGAAAG